MNVIFRKSIAQRKNYYVDDVGAEGSNNLFDEYSLVNSLRSTTTRFVNEIKIKYGLVGVASTRWGGGGEGTPGE